MKKLNFQVIFFFFFSLAINAQECTYGKYGKTLDDYYFYCFENKISEDFILNIINGSDFKRSYYKVVSDIPDTTKDLIYNHFIDAEVYPLKKTKTKIKIKEIPFIDSLKYLDTLKINYSLLEKKHNLDYTITTSVLVNINKFSVISVKSDYLKIFMIVDGHLYKIKISNKKITNSTMNEMAYINTFLDLFFKRIKIDNMSMDITYSFKRFRNAP